MRRPGEPTSDYWALLAVAADGRGFGAMHADMKGSVGIVRVASPTCLGLACGSARLATSTVFVPMAPALRLQQRLAGTRARPLSRRLGSASLGRTEPPSRGRRRGESCRHRGQPWRAVPRAARSNYAPSRRGHEPLRVRSRFTGARSRLAALRLEPRKSGRATSLRRPMTKDPRSIPHCAVLSTIPR